MTVEQPGATGGAWHPVASRRPAVRLPERFGILLVLGVYAAALTPALRFATGQGRLLPGDSDPGTSLVQLLALGMAGTWLLGNLRRVPDALRGLGPYLALAGLCVLSAAWSDFPALTLRRSATLLACVLFGAYARDRLGFEGLVRLVLGMLLVFAVASAALFVAAPGVGRDAATGYGNAMRGVFASKNSAGLGMLVGTVCALHLGGLPGARRGRYAGALLVLGGGLVLARSAASGLVALAAVAVGVRWWLRSFPARFLHAAVLAGVALAVLFTALFWPGATFDLAGREPDLTGRVPLWTEALRLWAERPWLGHGYAAFWNADAPEVRYLWRVLAWEAPNAHNGYLDMLLQLGVAGLLMQGAVWAVLAGRALRSPAPERRFVLLLLGVAALVNVNESSLPFPGLFTAFVAAGLVELRAPPRNGQVG